MWFNFRYTLLLYEKKKVKPYLPDPDYTSIFYLHIKYGLLNMLKIKTWHQSTSISKSLTTILSNLSIFHSLEVVYRVSEIQLQVGEDAN